VIDLALADSLDLLLINSAWLLERVLPGVGLK
jgi:hypothetical protein